MSTIDFGTTEELRARHPIENCRWYTVSSGEPLEGWGIFGDAVTHSEFGLCIAIFIGQGRFVLIDERGVYVDDDEMDDPGRVVGGAWISEQTFALANAMFNRDGHEPRSGS
ncbi:TPA: hypothetical protein DEB00_02725 [Candidatus Uhrbacteria bacterium]|nr:hypothetical protein [Candidatus Uhrbacteria bacterium]